MRDLLTTIVELIGAALIVAGVSMLSIPAALIAAGVLAICASFLVANR